MKISRKEYQDIANCIASSADLLDQGELRGRGAETKHIAENLATLLAEHNPRFNRQRFLTAYKVN